MNKKVYWIIHKYLENCKFQFKKLVYQFHERYITWLGLFSVQISVLKTMFLSITLNLLLVLFLKYACIQLQKIIGVPSITADLFKDIIIGGMGIAGVILGLYCSNIASIFSAKYANAPKSMVKLFQKDVVTNSCIKQIVGYIVLCAILLLECAIDANIPLSTLIVFLLLTVRVVVTFSMTGNRSYMLSDTFFIADIKFSDIYSAVKNAAKKNIFSSDHNFQNHYREIANNGIAILGEIVQYNTNIPKGQNSAMISFMGRIMAIIELYWDKKQIIPFDSLWFGKKAHYKQWHIASDTEISIALQTGTSLRPEEVKNNNWFEDELIEVNQTCIEKIISDDDILMLRQHLLNLRDISQAAGKKHQESYWVSYLGKIEKLTKTMIYSHFTDGDANFETALSSIDLLCSNYACVIVGINHFLTGLDLDAVLKACTSNLNGHRRNLNMLFVNTEACKKLAKQIDAEKSIEKEKITPDWYVEQIISEGMYKQLGSTIDAIYVAVKCVFEIGKQLQISEHNQAAATAFSHIYELLEKCRISINVIDYILPQLKARYIEKSVVWDEISTEQLKIQIAQIEQELPNLLIRCSSTYAINHWENRENGPDFLGLCYNQISEALIRAIENNNYSQFETLYKDYFGLVLLYHEYVRTDVIKHKEKHMAGIVFHVATAPFFEYALISGLAIIWGEFIGDSKWMELVQNSSSSYFEKSPKSEIIISTMAQYLQQRQHDILGIGNRDFLQTGWVQRIGHAISQNPAFAIEYAGFNKKLKTDSKLLTCYCGSSLMGDSLDLIDPEDVYMVTAVNKYLPDGQKYKSRYGWEKNYAE